MLRVTAYILRAIKLFKNKNESKNPLSADDIRSASVFWIRYIQTTAFSKKKNLLKSDTPLPKDSPMIKLNPFIGDEGIVRLGGRLRQSKLSIYQQSPAILPNHVLSRMILEQFHRNLLHSGLDYAGPFSIRTSSGRGHKSHKAWIAVFVCLAVKAIHLELVHDYSTSSFIAAFRRFTSRRGIPTDMYSDNGPNFRGADRELSQTFRTLLKDPTLSGKLSSDGTTWHFMPPYAPNFGGLWEAGVKSVKGHLLKLLSNLTPTSEEFTTLLCQIEGCLNSRPLVPINEDPESCEVLTPGYFLLGSALKIVPTPSYLNVPENHLTCWQSYQRILEHFWRFWSRVYLQTLQQRTKWFTVRPNVKIGDFVLIKNENFPPSKCSYTLHAFL